MTEISTARRIGVFGHVGSQNLGDEAIFSVVIQNIKRRYPNAEVLGFSSTPEDTSQRHKIESFPIQRRDEQPEDVTPQETCQVSTQDVSQRPGLIGLIKVKIKSLSWLYHLLKAFQQLWRMSGTCLKEPGFLLQCYRNMRGVDLLIIAGSSQLIDYVAGGAWDHPYTIFKWTLIAKARGTKVAFLSCGAGPIQSTLGRFFIRTSLSLADYRSYRDEVSRKCVEELGVNWQDRVYPDLVFGMSIEKGSSHAASIPTARPIVGINPVPFIDPKYWVGSSPDVYNIYIGKLVDFASWLVQRGYAVLFFPTQLRADPPAIHDIRVHMKSRVTAAIEKHVIDYSIHSFDDLISAISRADVIVATRFHGQVFSYLLNKPVIGIAYASKSVDLMEQMGQKEYALDILQFDLQSLQERFIMLESEKATIKSELPKRISVYRQALEVQYEKVFGLLEPVYE